MGTTIRHFLEIYHQLIIALIICCSLFYSNAYFAAAVNPNLKIFHVEHNENLAREIPDTDRFKILDHDLLSFSADLTDAYWIKPALLNGQLIEPGHLFSLRPINLHTVEMYIPSLQGSIPIKKVSRFDVDTTPKFSHRATIFEIPDNFISGEEVYFYLHSRSDNEVNFQYWEHDEYLIVDRKYSGIYSAMFASLFVLVLINFIFYTAIRDTNYLAYVCYLSAFLLFLMMTTGKLYEFASGEWLAGSYNTTFLIYGLACLTLTIFIQRFLNIKKYTPVFYKITVLYLVTYVVLMIMALIISPIPYISFSIANYMALFALPFIIYAAIKAWMAGHKQAKFFLVAFAPLIVMILLRVLSILNFIPTLNFALTGFQLAVVFQAIVLTIGLADQMLELRRERDEAQKLSSAAASTLQIQHEFTDFLAKVSEDIRAEPSGNHDKYIVSSFFERLKSIYSIEKGSVIYQVDSDLIILSDNTVNQAGYEDYIHDHITEVSRVCRGNELVELPTFNHPFFSRFTKMLVIPVHMRGHEWSGMLLNIELTRKLDLEQYEALHHYGTELVRTLVNAHKLKHYSIKAETDDLTQVMNRGAILDQLDKEIKSFNISQLPLSVAFVDIDHFKEINDTLGHEAGDTCLAYLALQIRRYLPDTAHVGRMGGDEFLFIFPNHLPEQVKGILTALSSSLETLIIEDSECSFTLSIGIAQFDNTSMDSKALLRKADETLYLSKENGRARITIAA